MSFPEPLKKNPKKVLSAPWAQAAKTKMAMFIPLAVKVGDKIIFGKYSGSEIKLEGKEYVVVREDDIIGIIE